MKKPIIFLTAGLIALTLTLTIFSIGNKPAGPIETEPVPYSQIISALKESTTVFTEVYVATAYCDCEKCCGKWALNRPNGVVYGSGGYELVQGLSVASSLPYGTIIYIGGMDEYNGYYVCHDRPAERVIEKYDGKIVDLFFNSHEQAVEFGKRQVTVEIIGKEIGE